MVGSMSSNPRSPAAAERALVLGQGHLEAAQYMEASHRFEQAEQQLELAIACFAEAGNNEHEREAWLRSAQVARRLGKLEAASDALRNAVALARAPGLEKVLALALGHLGMTEAQRGQPIEAAVAWHEAVELAEGLSELRMVAAIASNLGQLELGRGALDEAERAFRKALAAAVSDDNDAERGAAHNALGEIARARGDIATAQQHFEQALTSLTKAQDMRALALTYANLGNIARVGGNLERAQRLFDTSLRMSAHINDNGGVARAQTNLGNVAAARGLLGEARGHYQKGLQLDRKLGHVQAVVGGLVNLASLWVVEGRLDEARKHFAEASDTLRSGPPGRINVRTLADVLLLQGQVEARLGSLAAAEALFRDALEHTQVAGHRSGEARLRLCIAALDHARGHVAKALAAYRATITLIAAEGVASDIATAHLVIADCALAAGDGVLASASVAAARACVSASMAASAGQVAATEEGPRSGRLSRKAIVEVTSPRELLDVEAMSARVMLTKGAGRAEALAQAAELRAAGRQVDALALELTVADEGLLPEHDLVLAQEVAAAARELGIEPLAIDAETLAASFAASDTALSAIEAAHERAQAMGLGLLAARIRRRQIGLLLRMGLGERAETLRALASSWARAEGAHAEAARLERMEA